MERKNKIGSQISTDFHGLKYPNRKSVLMEGGRLPASIINFLTIDERCSSIHVVRG